MPRFFSIFTALVIILFAAELTPPVQDAVVVPFTTFVAQVGATLMKTWDAQVLADGKIIWDADSGFAVSIEAGCNGVEAGIVLVAAMLAFPAPWLKKLVGVAAGLLTVQALNLIRIISLFYIGQWSTRIFEWAHLYVWQALIMLDVLIVFLLWLSWVSKRESFPTAPPSRAGDQDG